MAEPSHSAGSTAAGLAGAALVLHRRLPRLRRSLAYLPEGPVIDWDAVDDLARWLDPMTAHLEVRARFGIRMGPPVVTRRWQRGHGQAALADPALTRLGDVPADATGPVGGRVVDQLRGRRLATTRRGDGGFTAGQPRTSSRSRCAGPTGSRRTTPTCSRP